MDSRPCQVSRWVDILDDVRVDWPWPYTANEIESLTHALPVPSAEQAAADIVYWARRYLSPPAAAARAQREKSNAATEIKLLWKSLCEVRDAVKGLSLEAIGHLDKWAVLKQQRAPDFLVAIHAFEMNVGLQNLPASSELRGRKGNPHLGAFQMHIRQIYESAYNGLPPTQGWPDFLDICLKPIDRDPPAHRKSRQAQIRRAKKRRAT